MTHPVDRRRERRGHVLRWAVLTGAGVGLLAGSAIVGGLIGVGLALPVAIVLLLVGDRRMRRPGAIPVIVYHSVSPDPSWLPWRDYISIRPETFRTHMNTLRRMKRKVISTAALVDARRGRQHIDPRSVVLHFDDGYLDNFLEAAPILRAFDYPATIFASADFIDQSDMARSRDAGCAGYMNRAELRQLDADPLFAIEAHGLDHGRIPVSGVEVMRLDSPTWRYFAPHVWARQPGPKARWYEATDPAPMHLGEPLFESDSKLCGRWIRDGRQESGAERDTRVEDELRRARSALEEVLGRQVDQLCWPFDRWTEDARRAAQRAGFHVFTGGRGENRAGEDPELLSRTHVQDRAFGGGPLWLEALAFRAKVQSASGNLYWSLVVMLASALRLRRFPRPWFQQ